MVALLVDRVQKPVDLERTRGYHGDVGGLGIDVFIIEHVNDVRVVERQQPGKGGECPDFVFEPDLHLQNVLDGRNDRFFAGKRPSAQCGIRAVRSVASSPVTARSSSS